MDRKEELTRDIEHTPTEEKTEHPKMMTKKEFWIRFSIWVTFALLIPLGFIIWRYGLFTATDSSTASNVKLSGWGVIAFVITAIFFVSLINQASKGLPGDSMLLQCIDGAKLLIPLLLFILLLENIKNNIKQFEQVLIVLLVCETIAVPINPLKKWAYQHNIKREGHFWKSVLGKVFNKDNKE